MSLYRPAWLGDLPRRIGMPPMRMQERVQWARTLAEKHGVRLTDVDDWRPLLQFTQGNPLTLTVLVRQALHDQLKTKAEIEALISRVRAGEAAFEDEEREGRSKSLGASLSYGFEQAFNDEDRKKLALLYNFQEVIHVNILSLMGHPEFEWSLPEVRGLTPEAGVALLNRAAEVGLLTRKGVGFYSIHPALPWFFKELFDRHFAPTSLGEGDQNNTAFRAFAEAIGHFGSCFHDEYNNGNRTVLADLIPQEVNLLQAWQIARKRCWWKTLLNTMQGLRFLYQVAGRRAQWSRLVGDILPDLVDPATDGPLPGLEEEWLRVTDYRVRIARELMRWDEASRLQNLHLSAVRERTVAALTVPARFRSELERREVAHLAVSLYETAEIQREMGQPDCIATYTEALAFSESLDDRAGIAFCSYSLGMAYNRIPSVRSLSLAENWYRFSLMHRKDADREGKGRCLAALGMAAYERLMETAAKLQPAEIRRQMKEIIILMSQALNYSSNDVFEERSHLYNNMGIICMTFGDNQNAIKHFRDSLKCKEIIGDSLGAGNTLYNIALHLFKRNLLIESREYALSSLNNLISCGEGALDMAERTERLIEDIDRARAAQGG